MCSAIRITDSVAGTFGATYTADGSISHEQLPGGYSLRIDEDPAGGQTQRTYQRDRDGTVVLPDSVSKSPHGQVAAHAGWPDRSYRYDAVGRLTAVGGTAAGVCTRRSCTFDVRTNRTALATSIPGGTTLAHYGNDRIYRETKGTERQTWELDAAHRFRSWTSG
ncbi:hypothetical protein [Streptomyces cyaneofuscatus]|uniref:hypothetical protein n=1 Tax=Streptomyces cyaneofuscatus TaxID=66883 RepID=UPI003699772E